MDSNIVEIRGYVPGDIGWVTQLHGTYYNQYWGLSLNFEAEVARELSEFLLQFDATRDGFWIAVVNDEIVGSIALDGRQLNEDGARLRWFIVAPQIQGAGIGKRLMQTAIDFCLQARFAQAYLWTFAGLMTARRLYDQFGFVLDEEYSDELWGRSIMHQKLKRSLCTN